MLDVRAVMSREGVEIADVACRHAAGRGRPGEQTAGHAVVFVRRGCFARTADGVQTMLDPTIAYCMNPGEEQRYDHLQPHGDDCTAVFLTPSLVATLWGDLTLPSGPVPVSPEVDLEHRLLVACSRRGDDPHELVERAMTLSASALTQANAHRVASSRPATARAQRALADAAREALAADSSRGLTDLAILLAVSPHHLSRVFRLITGHTISRHRMRLRVRSALERLTDGESDLARVAADTGFADQSHLCRVVRRETGQTPSALRGALT